ncbi:MAG: hypothetical protein ABS81_10275 [Pseudonocardia sp. SCN 72-86]|nr:MAG: hypothetical protein ABS81_10275 [Pseudonocardia sp. SCN 72-86]
MGEPAELDVDQAGGAIVTYVHERLRQAILRCELGPGTAISQVQVAKDLGISRTPLREVLRLLEREGLVESQHNHRFRVSGFSLDDLVEVYASRIMLETLATRQSMRSMSLVVLDQLRQALGGMTESAEDGEYEAWQAHHRRFHAVLNGNGGARLTESLERLADYADRYRRIYGASAPLAWRAGLRQHEWIVEAAARFDGEETSIRVASHLASAAARLVRSVDPSHDLGLIEQALQACHVPWPEGTVGPSSNGSAASRSRAR